MLPLLSGSDIDAGLNQLRNRARELLDKALPVARKIIDRVAESGDQELVRLAAELDGISLDRDRIRVGREEIDEALSGIDPALRAALTRARDNITAFHRRELRNSWFQMEENGVILGQKIVPLDSAGLYIPGGKAAYPSTVLMNAIPAKVAGVRRLVITTPPGDKGEVNRAVLAAAGLLGIGEIYRVGGAQAIAALALGTETIKPVDKIVGPGNIYVTAAKKLLFGEVGIDMVAGPSEIVVIADRTADPDHVACDLVSQAEHDPMASAVLVTTDRSLALKVNEALGREVAASARKEIIAESLSGFGRAFLVNNLDEAVEIVNRLAPEHLEIITEDPWRTLGGIRNAGSVFLGKYTPEAVGDYLAGVNHVLPTGGAARFSSALGVDDFVKKIQFTSYTREALDEAGEDIVTLAESEGLTGHARSVTVRREPKTGGETNGQE